MTHNSPKPIAMALKRKTDGTTTERTKTASSEPESVDIAGIVLVETGRRTGITVLLETKGSWRSVSRSYYRLRRREEN